MSGGKAMKGCLVAQSQLAITIFGIAFVPTLMP